VTTEVAELRSESRGKQSQARRNGQKAKRAMKVRELLAGVDPVRVSGSLDVDARGLSYDSRKVQEGDLFFALRGNKTDGNEFITEAMQRGAVAIATESDTRPNEVSGGGTKVTWIGLAEGSSRRVLATSSANFYGQPSAALQLVGITGTNGKTTTAFLVDSILRAAGKVTGLIGTTGYRTPNGWRKATHTTPESLGLQEMFAEIRDSGGTAVTLETSSHALALDRLWGCHFAAAVFTNLTHDHLNFHGTFENYFAAKRKLFDGTGAGAPDTSVLNMDDRYGRDLLKELSGRRQRTLSYGLNEAAQVGTRKFPLVLSGLEFTANTPAGPVRVDSPLAGRVNIYNILASIGVGVALGINVPAIEEGIRTLKNVPGRFERVDEGQPFVVVVDYAHADDAIRNLLVSAREISAGGRVLLLFGAGGERDRTTRPLMGEAAGANADLVVLTSDNPRSEDPLRIINDVVVGLQKVNAKYRIEPDREKALELIFDEARPGDLVILAGKGHENYQILRDRTFEFDDREMARKILRARGYGKKSA
jgi:UDP-N-acetylmuramoyl-L-alanyl-D-glutamate--2,6-diaminopimelate ligase